MKWDEIPKGTSFAMSQDGVNQLRAGRPKAFFTGVICGAVLVIGLQSCGSDTTDKPDPKPGPAVSNTHKPSN